MEYIDGIEYNDKFISDKSLDVLDTLAYLQLVGSYDVRNRIIFNFNDSDNIKEWLYLRKERKEKKGNGVKGNDVRGNNIEYDSHKKYRIDADDVTQEIVHLLLKIDKNIFDMVIGEFNFEEDNKYYGFRYPTYAKCYYWDEKNCKKRDENFIQIICESGLWKEFVKTSRHRGLTLEDIFKIAIVRFLERRYDLCLEELRSDNSGYNKEWVME